MRRIYPNKRHNYTGHRVCKSVHDFSLLMIENCYINREDRAREDMWHPRYYLGNTGIRGSTADDALFLWFPRTIKFPLAKAQFADFRKKLSDMDIALRNMPREVTGYMKTPAFNYTLDKPNSSKYHPRVGRSRETYAFIRPTEDGKKVHALLFVNKHDGSEDSRLEKIIEAIITGLKVNIK